MPRTSKKLEWQNVSVEDLPKSTRKQYDAYVDSYQNSTKPLRQQFEDAFILSARRAGMISEKQTLRFGYAYGGKVGIAIDDVEDDRTTRSGFDTKGMR